MMRRLLPVMIGLCSLLPVSAQVQDAFHGILPVTDPSMKVSLNGNWKLKVVEGIDDHKKIPVEDKSWKNIPVPGCWEAYGFCRPTYGSPDSLTGYYRTSFMVPERWKGQRVIIRFDGVLYGYDLWINGKEVGSWYSAYNTALFDITDFINKKKEYQELAMRVV